MAKQKIILDKEKHEKHKVLRIPMARHTEWHKDKSKYSRKVKHKHVEQME